MIVAPGDPALRYRDSGEYDFLRERRPPCYGG